MKRYNILSGRSFRKVAHTADIHVRNSQRFDEYKLVFDRFYDSLKTNKVDMIVVAGDIFHSKTQISPESIEMVYGFFKNLNEIAPTIVIPGNHDANLSNENRQDAISALMNVSRELDNLYYLRDSGIYRFGNIDFYHFSIFNNFNDFKFNINDPDQINIGLYHAPFLNATNDVEFKIHSEVGQSKFKGLDIVMMGDIHRQQKLGTYTKDELLINGSRVIDITPEIWYPGSLISQNYGEDAKKGYLLWNIEKRSTRNISIPNDYTYYTIYTKDGKLPTGLKITEKHPRVRLFIEKEYEADTNNIISSLNAICAPTELSTNYIASKRNKNKIEHLSELDNYNDIDIQNKAIRQYIKDNDLKISTANTKKIIELNYKIEDNLKHTHENFNQLISTQNIELKKIEFANFLSYGKKNVIDFTTLNGMVGILGENRVGKSSLIELIIFSLFGSTSKPLKKQSAVNNKSKSLTTKIYFTVNNIEYIIYRKVGSVYYTQNILDVYRIEDGDEVLLNGDSKKDTEKFLTTLIGTKENILRTNILAQNAWSNFIYSKDTDRKRALASFIGLDVLELKYNMAKEMAGDLEAEKKYITKSNPVGRLAMCDQDLRGYNEKVKTTKKHIRQLEGTISKLKDKLHQLNTKLKPVHSNFDDHTPDVLGKKKDNAVAEQQRTKLVIKSDERKKTEYDEKIKSLKLILNKLEAIFDKAAHEQIQDQLQTALDELHVKDKKLAKQRITLKHKIDNIDILNKEPYHLDEEICRNCTFMSNIFADKEYVEREKPIFVNLSKEVAALRDSIEKMKQQEIKFKNIRNDIKSIKMDIEKTNYAVADIEKEIIMNTHRMDQLEATIVAIDEQLANYENHKSDIACNIKINQEINITENEMRGLETKLKNDQIEYSMSIANVNKAEKERESIKEDLNRLDEIESDILVYNNFTHIFHRNNLQHAIINNVLPLLNHQINSILKNVVDFTVNIESEEDSININLKYNDNDVFPIEATSGMESVMSELAIRLALIEVSNNIKFKFLAVDEGFSALDTNIFNNLINLFAEIKKYVNTVFVISHIEILKDVMDKNITVKFENGYSKIDSIS